MTRWGHTESPAQAWPEAAEREKASAKSMRKTARRVEIESDNEASNPNPEP
jgi:hypothetical protein